jgi:hypothetical protein
VTRDGGGVDSSDGQDTDAPDDVVPVVNVTGTLRLPPMSMSSPDER